MKNLAAMSILSIILSACAALNGQPSQAPQQTTAASPAQKPAADGCVKTKSKDGSFEGCVYGNPPAKSKFSKVYIGMTKYQAEKLLGHPQDTKYVTNWSKAWIPFYQGTDARRLVWLYEGQGSVSFDTGGAYADGGQVVEINYNPKIEL